MPYHETGKLHRDLSAAGTGVATALLGGAIPLIGAAGGIVLQILEPTTPALRPFEHVTEGVVDGSLALIVKGLLS